MALLASPRATIACIDAWQEDFRPDMAAFDVPTLVIHGTSDGIVPFKTTGPVAARMIRNSKFIEYDGAPHGFLATNAERATQDLLDFLA
jgi:non-heme chloroperoxidase